MSDVAPFVSGGDNGGVALSRIAFARSCTMSEPNTGMMNAAEQIFVLAFDLVDAEVEQLPDQLTTALTSPPVQAAIKKTLLDFAKSKSKPDATPVTADDSAKLLESLQKGVTDAATQRLRETIMKTPQYQRLDASLKAFEAAAKSSALGVWVDKNRKILYVVGAALVLGTGTVLYVTRTGLPLLDNALEPLKGKQFEILQIGTLNIKASLWDFKPDARILGARIVGTADWQSIKLELRFGVLSADAKVQQAEGSAVVRSGAFSLGFTGSTKMEKDKNLVNLALNVGYQKGKFDLKLGAKYSDDLVAGTASLNYKLKQASIGAQANVGEKAGGGTAYGGLLTISIPID
jgi:hypothetical protein